MINFYPELAVTLSH